MDNLDLERAKKLLQTAEHLVEKGDLAGAGGLAYQAFESAVIAVTRLEGQKDYPDHTQRRKKAEELLKVSQDKVKRLWAVRNVDFYGNEKVGEKSREIKKEEIENSVQEVRKIIKALEEKETP